MKKVLTGKKNLEYCVKQKLRELAEKNHLSGYNNMTLIQLESFLTQNVKGFSLRKNFLKKSMTISWFADGKQAEITYGIDPESGEIYEESH